MQGRKYRPCFFDPVRGDVAAHWDPVKPLSRHILAPRERSGLRYSTVGVDRSPGSRFVVDNRRKAQGAGADKQNGRYDP